MFCLRSHEVRKQQILDSAGVVADHLCNTKTCTAQWTLWQGAPLVVQSSDEHSHAVEGLFV